MALIVSALPREAEKILASELGDELELQHIPTASAGAAETLALPHRVFELATLELADGQWSEHARLIGWDVLLFDGRKPCHTIHLRADGARRRLELAGVTPYAAEAVVNRVRAVERHRMTRAGEFDLAKLVAPPLGLSAIWCRSRGSAADFFAVNDHLTGRSRVETDRTLFATWRIAACRSLLDRALESSE